MASLLTGSFDRHVERQKSIDDIFEAEFRIDDGRARLIGVGRNGRLRIGHEGRPVAIGVGAIVGAFADDRVVGT